MAQETKEEKRRRGFWKTFGNWILNIVGGIVFIQAAAIGIGLVVGFIYVIVVGGITVYHQHYPDHNGGAVVCGTTENDCVVKYDRDGRWVVSRRLYSACGMHYDPRYETWKSDC